MAESATDFRRFPPPASAPPAYGEGIGLGESDPHELIDTLKQGLPVTSFDALREGLQLSRVELAVAIGVSERTLARRLKSGRFTAEESERIYRLARLLARAGDVLESNADAARWLKTSKLYLKGSTPLQFADTEVGARTVERLLGRIEHGVAS
jgi:putative toxin-antitoxin system antitoxin component (TIGR02293 family)